MNAQDRIAEAIAAEHEAVAETAREKVRKAKAEADLAELVLDVARTQVRQSEGQKLPS